MVQDDDNGRDVGFEEFCSMLDGLDLKVCDQNETIDSVPYTQKVHFLLYVMSSSQNYNLKQKALLRMKRIYKSWLSDNDIHEELINYTKDFHFHLLISETNEFFLEELMSALVILLTAIINKKSEKFEILFEMVSKCVLSKNELLNNKILTFLIENFYLFDENKKKRFSQFLKFVVSGLEKMPDNPKIALMVLKVLSIVLECDCPDYFVENLSENLPLFFDTMNKFVLSPFVYEFLAILRSIFMRCPAIFGIGIMKTLNHIVSLLKNKDICYEVHSEILCWLNVFVSLYGSVIEKSFKGFISVILKIILDFKIDMYSVNYGNMENSREPDSHSNSRNVYDPYESLFHISKTFSSGMMYELLLSNVKRLLCSSDWSHITVAYDVMGVILKFCGSKIMLNPWQAFRMLKKRVSHKNTLVFLSSVKGLSMLCETFPNDCFDTLHGEALLLILKNLQKHGEPRNTEGAEKAMNIITSIWRVSTVVNKHKILEKKLLLAIYLLSALASNEHYLVSLVNLITNNAQFIRSLWFSQSEKSTYDLFHYLVRTLNQIIFLKEFHYAVPCLLFCIENAAEVNFWQGSTNYITRIINYIDKFNTLNKLPGDDLQIQSFFFPLLTFLASRKTDHIEKIFPKIASTIKKIFSQTNFASNHLKFKNIPEINTTQQEPLNPTGIYDDVNCELDTSVTLAITLVDNYTNVFSSNIPSYLTALVEIVPKADNELFHSRVVSYITQLIKIGFRVGNKDDMKTCLTIDLKNKLLKIFKDGSDNELLNVIKAFSEFFRLENFDIALNSNDIIDIMSRIETYVFDAATLEETSIEKINHMCKFTHNSQGFVSRLLKAHKLEVVNASIPMCRRALKEKPINYSSIFIKFMTEFVDMLLDYVDTSNGVFVELVPVMIEFCNDVFQNRDYGIMVSSASAIIKLRKLFRNEFEDTIGSDPEVVKLINEFYKGI